MTTISTVEHADYAPSPVVTPVTPRVTQDDVVAIDKKQVDALKVGDRPRPDPDARSRYARLLYRITGWPVFGTSREASEDAGYAQLAEGHAAEDAERRQIARRRPPAWTDED
jgi:hypothetical protein